MTACDACRKTARDQFIRHGIITNIFPAVDGKRFCPKHLAQVIRAGGRGAS